MERLEDMLPWRVERQSVLETAREMARLGLVTGAGGNVSLRLPGDTPLVVITPTQHPYDALQPEDLPIIDAAGRDVEGKLQPSTEWRLHLAAYQARRDVGAVIHCHPVYATACAVARLGIPPIVDELVALVGGEVQVAEYGLPGSRDLAVQARDALGNRKAVLLSNHGLLAVGQNLTEALNVCQLVEQAAHVYVMARLLGSVHTLSPEAVAMEEELFRTRERDLPKRFN